MRIHVTAGAASACLLVVAVDASAQSGSSAATHEQRVQSWTDEIVVIGARQGYAVPKTSAGTRTDTPLVEVPQSIQVLTRTLIQEQDRRTLGDALVNVAGVTPTRSDEVLFIPPIIRGFPAEVYLDGLSVFAGNQQAYDPNSLVGIERIGVLKGPSATLYGGGIGTPLGGVINLESVRPNDKLGGYLAMRSGSYWTLNPSGDVNVPLARGFAVRMAGEYQSSQSWIDEVHGRRWSLQPSLSVQIASTTDLMIQGQLGGRSNLEYSGLPAGAALAGAIKRNAFPGSPLDQPLTTSRIRMGQATLRHAFSDRFKLQMSGRYFSNVTNEQGSFVYPDFLPTGTIPPLYDVFSITMRNRTREATADANLAGDFDLAGGRHKLLAGASYDWTSFYSAMGLLVSDSPSGFIDLSKPEYDLHYAPQLPVNSQTDDRFTTFASYFQDQAAYGRLHLTFGVRVTSLKFLENSTVGAVNDKTYTHVSPRAGATFEAVKGVSLFTGYATAFRAPFGFVGMAAPVPETSSNIEAGLKLALASAGLYGTMAIFRQTHDNVVTTDPINVGFYVQSGRQRARGAEIDLVWEPNPAFSLLVNYAYTDTFDNGLSPGDRLVRVPKSSGRIAARYRVLRGTAQGLSFGAGLSGFTSRELTLPNTIPVPGYVVVDAQMSYDIGRFTLGVSVVNLGDRRAFDPYSYLGYPVVAPNQPRSAYLTLKVRV